MLKAGDQIYLTKNIKLACALITLGHPIKNDESCVIEEDGKQEVHFVFEDKGGSASADARKWNKGLEAMEPESNIAYLWAYAHNRDRLLDEIKKSIPMVRVRYGNKVLLYAKNASDEQKRRIMSKL
ncbi:MAG: hypothetical protein EBR82_21925 [Caulobacteraceae bacterium]|jgi:hypothetical protein|nr:hypothetical protein [Caulobacteraceae bacterium]